MNYLTNPYDLRTYLPCTYSIQFSRLTVSFACDFSFLFSLFSWAVVSQGVIMCMHGRVTYNLIIGTNQKRKQKKRRTFLSSPFCHVLSFGSSFLFPLSSFLFHPTLSFIPLSLSFPSLFRSPLTPSHPLSPSLTPSYPSYPPPLSTLFGLFRTPVSPS